MFPIAQYQVTMNKMYNPILFLPNSVTGIHRDYREVAVWAN